MAHRASSAARLAPPPAFAGVTVGRARALPALPADAERLDAAEVLRTAIDALGPSRVALSASFGVEDMVLLDLLSRITAAPRVFTLDTGRLPAETYEVMERARERYGVAIEVFAPDAAEVEAMVGTHGPNLFYRTVELRHRCCEVRKLGPLRRALSTVDGWITGLRRDQTPNRFGVPKIGRDLEHGMIWKVAPLADWTSEDVWAYVRERDVPYNALHDRGYPSIGCAPCTRAVAPGDDPRSGRWWWEMDGQRECGLHVASVPLRPTGSPPA